MARKRLKRGERPKKGTAKIALSYAGEPIYSNYAEVSSAMHEFQILFALLPTKPKAEQIEQMVQGSALNLDAQVQILLPPTVIPGLIKALTTTKDRYEALAGPIKELEPKNE
jgi:hypothetical protein